MRVFIAVPFPDNLKEQFIEMQREAASLGNIKPVECENMHLTLKFLGEVDERKVAEISNVLQSINLQSFHLSIKGLGVFPNRNYVRVLWAGVDAGRKEFMELQASVDEKISKLGFPKEREYIPHLTIARIKHLQKKEEFLRLVDRYSAKDFGCFKVECVDLMESILSRRGPTYNRITGIYLK